MKYRYLIPVASLIAVSYLVNAQPVGESTTPTIIPAPKVQISPQSGGYLTVAQMEQGVANKPLPTIDLDFPGGMPGDLTKAIEKASGTSLNVIIPKQDADVQLPAFKLKHVTVPEVFDALRIVGRTHNTEQERVTYEFMSSGKNKEEAIWVFVCNRQKFPPTKPENTGVPFCRFYNLKTILSTGEYTFENIKSVLETAWTGLGIKPMPKLVFNKETALLIAIGSEHPLLLIDEVVKQLSQNVGFSTVPIRTLRQPPILQPTPVQPPPVKSIEGHPGTDFKP